MRTRHQGVEAGQRARVACGREHGQAAVEFVALLPVLAVVALACAQAAVAGWAAWSAAGVARVGARADALGESPRGAVREALPAVLDRGARVRAIEPRADGAHRIVVRLRVPSVVPGLRLGTVAATAELPGQGAG